MDKYAIISTSYYEDGRWKDFTILSEGLTKNQVLALKNAIPVYYAECKTKHNFDIDLEIEGFESPIRGDRFWELLNGRVIPIFSLEDFE